MKLTVLGNTGPYPGADSACSGYLLESKGYHIVLDFGSGTCSNLQKHIKIEEIDLAICSHLHLDHFSDLYVLRYALQAKKHQLPLLVAPEPPLEFASLFYKNVYKINKITNDLVVKKDNLTLSFKALRHPVLDFGIKIYDQKTTFLYTGDTSFTPTLVDFAKGVDVMLCDATFLEDIVSEKHLSVKEACEIANEAKIKTLILTHFNPELDPNDYLIKGKKIFNGNIKITKIGETYDLTELSS